MNRLPFVITCVLILLATAGTLLAQQADCRPEGSDDRPDYIGCVNRIKQTKWLVFERTVPASAGVEIRRVEEAGMVRTLSPVRLNDPLTHRDLLRLGKSVDLELFLSGPGHSSRVVLGRGGLWELRKDSVPRLTMTHGQMVVRQLEGRLEAYLENVLNVIHATTVYYDVDSTAGESYVFLREGHISFPEYGIDVQGRDSLWVLRQGVAPRPVPATENMRRRWRQREDFVNEEMWRKAETPLLRRSTFWMLAAGIAAGAAVVDCTVTGVLCDGGHTSGAYRIPLD